MATATTPHDLVRLLAAQARNGPIGLLFDYDGTLADIAPPPDLAHLDAAAARQLAALARLPGVSVGIITGRSLPGLLSVSGPLPGLTLAVNGGLRILAPDGDWVQLEATHLQPAMNDIAAELAAFVDGRPGMILENKELSLTVHYRLHPAARPELDDLLTRLDERFRGRLRLLRGKESVEIQPDVAWDKGRAAAELLDRWQVSEAALFLGDDRIDEPAFAEVRRRGGVTCCIADGRAETEAEWLLASPVEGRRLLDLLPEAIGRGDRR